MSGELSKYLQQGGSPLGYEIGDALEEGSPESSGFLGMGGSPATSRLARMPWEGKAPNPNAAKIAKLRAVPPTDPRYQVSQDLAAKLEAGQVQ